MIATAARRPIRSKLFVPGSRPELFAKALAGPADAVSFDLEDAVAESAKDAARANVREALQTLPGDARHPTVIVRANAPGTALFEADLDAVVRLGLHVLNLPKIEGPEEIVEVAEQLDRLEAGRSLAFPTGILANIESPAGLRRAAEIARAHPRVVGLQLGLGDLFEPFGISRSHAQALDAVRLAVRLAAAEANIPAYDGAFADVADEDGFRREVEGARALGFAGKSCVHPRQVPIANALFRPSEAEIARARTVLEAAAEKLSSGTGAFLLKGAMIDAPFIERARHIVMQAEESQDDR